jgi:hypothetical protein
MERYAAKHPFFQEGMSPPLLQGIEIKKTGVFERRETHGGEKFWSGNFTR